MIIASMASFGKINTIPMKRQRNMVPSHEFHASKNRKQISLPHCPFESLYLHYENNDILHATNTPKFLSSMIFPLIKLQ